MEQNKNSKNNKFNINEDNNNYQIEFNYDFELDKTKSLNKFPLKEITYKDFYLDDTYKNFSKSVKNFNYHICFAPKLKIKQPYINPTPLIFEKQNDLSDFLNLNKQQTKIIEDTYSEKELSLDYESSFSSDLENEYKEINNIKKNRIDVNNDLIADNQIINFNNNNYLISRNLLYNNSDKKNESKNICLNKNKIIINMNNKIDDEKQVNSFKSFEDIANIDFSLKNNFTCNYKYNIKSIRNSLYREKLKTLKKYYKEVEYSIKDSLKIKYDLNIINNKSKRNILDYCCNIIPINDKNENEEMSDLRKTISYNKSKLKLENKKINGNKGITIYDVLLNNKKNKNENKNNFILK